MREPAFFLRQIPFVFSNDQLAKASYYVFPTYLFNKVSSLSAKFFRSL
jgi:hypothetical protein